MTSPNSIKLFLQEKNAHTEIYSLTAYIRTNTACIYTFWQHAQGLKHFRGQCNHFKLYTFHMTTLAARIRSYKAMAPGHLYCLSPGIQIKARAYRPISRLSQDSFHASRVIRLCLTTFSKIWSTLLPWK